MPDVKSLEARVDADRAALNQSLDALTQTLAPENLSDQLGTAVQDYGGELGQQVWQMARKNPTAFALVGAGVGLLLTGTGTRSARTQPTPQAVVPEVAMQGFDARVAAADEAMKEEMTGMSNAHPTASRMSAALNHGLDRLPEPAKKRVLKARKAAISAQEKVEKQAARAARKTRTFAHEQPLAVGALAMGVGALIGALIGPTRKEDEVLGAHRDSLMRQAKETLQAEMARVTDNMQESLQQRSA